MDLEELGIKILDEELWYLKMGWKEIEVRKRYGREGIGKGFIYISYGFSWRNDF